jgi:hypothetical protein
MGNYGRYAETLAGLGYDVTPVEGKRPFIQDWQNNPPDAQDYEKHSDHSIGVVLGGKHNLVAIDIDVRNKAACDVIRQIADNELGPAPERVGNAPKTLFLYRCEELTRKRRTSVFSVDEQDACVELLGDGQQFVASGKHPDTGKNYSWIGDRIVDIPPENLTEVSVADLENFLNICEFTLSNHGVIKTKAIFDSGSNNSAISGFDDGSKTADIKKITEAAAYIPASAVEDYSDWTKIGFAIKGATGEDGRELFHTVSAKSDKYDPVTTDRLYDTEVHSAGAGTIIAIAKQHGFDPLKWDANKGPADIASWDAEPAQSGDGSFTAASVVGPIPAREWVLDGWFPARTVAMLFGAGGVGKTLLMQQFANAVADGEPFLGIDTMKMPVLSVMCEDDADEVKRRQLCINESIGIDEFSSGPENLHLWPRVGSDNVLVTWPSGGQDEPGAFYKQLCDKVASVKGDSDKILVILDTAADMFGGNENERRTVNTFLKTYLGSIVVNYNATVILLAHPSLSGLKGNSPTGLSGSTAWENSVRSRSYLSREEDSDDVRILSRKKSNYSDISGNNDIKLIWENGVLAIPSSPDALDRINSTTLKHAIMAEVDIAWGEKNAIRKQGPRGYKTTLPSMLKQHKPGAVIKAFNDLIMGGNIVHIERFGFKTEKGI